MTIHSIFVANANGVVLFSKLFSAINLSKEIFFESSGYWSTSRKVSLTLSGDVIAFMDRSGDFLIFTCGTDESDEVILSSVSDAIRGVLIDLLGGEEKLTEAALLDAEMYGRFAVCVEEIVSHGIVETLDVGEVMRLAKLKNG